MSANIYKSSFAGVTPGWHHVGVPMEPGANADRAMELAKQKNWGVRAIDMQQFIASGLDIDTQGLHVLVRRDEGKLIIASETMVFDNYLPISNEDVFGPMVELLVGESLSVDCAGVLGRLGNRAFMTFFAGDSIVSGGEGYQRFLVAVANHSGRDAVRILPTGIRVVCENTEQAAIRGAKAMISIQHNQAALSRFYNDPDAFRQLIGLSKHFEHRLEQMSETMQQIPFNAMQWRVVVNNWEKNRAEPDTERKTVLLENARAALMESWFLESERAAKMDQPITSLWTAKQAASTYAQHLARGGWHMRAKRSMRIAEGEDVPMMTELNKLIAVVARDTRHFAIDESEQERALAWLSA